MVGLGTAAPRCAWHQENAAPVVWRKTKQNKIFYFSKISNKVSTEKIFQMTKYNQIMSLNSYFVSTNTFFITNVSIEALIFTDAPDIFSEKDELRCSKI